jgi:hypothetical protein
MSDVTADKSKPGQPDTGPNKPDHPDTGPKVSITINGTTVLIHRGHRPVAEIKAAGGVNPAHELEQVENGQLRPLPDDGAITLKGDEVFISHPRDSASS